MSYGKQVQLVIQSDLLTPGRLRLAEVTPAYNAITAPGGWGGPNAARSDVSKFTVTLGYPGKTGYTWETSGLIDGPLALGLFSLTAGNLTAYLPYSEPVRSDGEFRSGPLYLAVQAIARRTMNRYRASYAVRLTVVPPAGSSVWVKKNDEWVDITLLGAPVTGGSGWQWQCPDTLDEYTKWQLRQNGQTLDQGMVLAESLSTTAVQRIEQTVIGFGEQTLFLVGVERKAWANQVLAHLTTLNDQQSVPGRFGGNPSLAAAPRDTVMREAKLAFIGQLLDFLDGPLSGDALGFRLDALTGGGILKRIQAELAQLNA